LKHKQINIEAQLLLVYYKAVALRRLLLLDENGVYPDVVHAVLLPDGRVVVTEATGDTYLFESPRRVAEYYGVKVVTEDTSEPVAP
jgi:hypothetical protein